MADYAHSIQELIDAFGRLPGVGPKSAQRITFHLLKVDKAESQRLVAAITTAVTGRFMLTTTLLSIAYNTNIRRQVTLTVDLTFEDPYFDTDLTVHGLCFRDRIIDIRTKCMQRDPAFFILFRTGHISTCQPARNFHFDTLGTYTHRRSNCLLHRTLIGNTSFDLLGDRFTYQLGVKLRAFDLENVDLNILVGDFLQLFLDLIYFATTFTDYNAGTGCVDRKGNAF